MHPVSAPGSASALALQLTILAAPGGAHARPVLPELTVDSPGGNRPAISQPSRETGQATRPGRARVKPIVMPQAPVATGEVPVTQASVAPGSVRNVFALGVIGDDGRLATCSSPMASRTVGFLCSHLSGTSQMDEPFSQAGDQALAPVGWLVEVDMGTDKRLDLRWLAVTIPNAADAEREVLRFPGLSEGDRRTAKRPLSALEIAQMKLKVGAVRPYDATSWVEQTPSIQPCHEPRAFRSAISG